MSHLVKAMPTYCSNNGHDIDVSCIVFSHTDAGQIVSQVRKLEGVTE